MAAINFYELINNGTASIIYWDGGRKAQITLEFCPMTVKVNKKGLFKVNKVWYRL